jgi:hypothetical protein
MRQLAVKCLLGSAITVLALSVNPAGAADLPQVEADKGLVVFYRTNKFAGGAIRFNLNHASGTLGQLLRGTYLYKSVDPGEHAFWSQAISQDSITIVVEAGKTYYVEGVVKMGLLAGRPNFNQVSKERALEALAAM